MPLLIIAAGNPLRQDDGIGPALLELLQKESQPEDVIFRDIGTDGLALIDLVKGPDRVLLIDAVNMGGNPGKALFFTPNEANFICKGDSLSTHGIGISEVLKLMNDMDGTMPNNMTIFGIQPKLVGFGDALSPKLQKNIKTYMRLIIAWIHSIKAPIDVVPKGTLL
jgi:hydrogenase maturation protease